MNESRLTQQQAELDKGLNASDFLLDPDAFVSRCIAAHPKADAVLNAPQRAALADAVRAGRPRIEVVEAIRRYVAPSPSFAGGSLNNGLARDWSNYVCTEQLVDFAPDDDVAFIQQAYSQILARSPTSIEGLEGKFDLAAGLGRPEFIQRLALRSPACRLSTDRSPAGVGGGMGRDARPFFTFIEPASADGWFVAKDVYLQPARTVEGVLQLGEGWVLTGPKRSFAAGSWDLSIDIVQPERAKIEVDVVANAGLDVLVRLNLVGAARFVVAFVVEPWHNFLEVRLHKAAEAAELRQLKIRELMLRQS